MPPKKRVVGRRSGISRGWGSGTKATASSRKVQSIRYASATSGTGSRRHRWMKCSLDEVLVPRVRNNNVGKENFAPSAAAAASSPRIQSTHQERKMGVARPHTEVTRAVAMSHEATHFMEGLPTRKRCRSRSPVAKRGDDWVLSYRKLATTSSRTKGHGTRKNKNEILGAAAEI